MAHSSCQLRQLCPRLLASGARRSHLRISCSQPSLGPCSKKSKTTNNQDVRAGWLWLGVEGPSNQGRSRLNVTDTRLETSVTRLSPTTNRSSEPPCPLGRSGHTSARPSQTRPPAGGSMITRKESIESTVCMVPREPGAAPTWCAFWCTATRVPAITSSRRRGRSRGTSSVAFSAASRSFCGRKDCGRVKVAGVLNAPFVRKRHAVTLSHSLWVVDSMQLGSRRAL